MRMWMTTLAALALSVGAVRAADTPAPTTGRQALDQIKALVGTWEGPIERMGGAKGSVRYELTGGGHVVVERLFPGTDHEMMTVYHLDGDTLLASHYCSSGNQPLLKLEKATADELSFGFAGGTNLDPAKDVHIRSGRLRFVDAATLESEWDVYEGSKQAMTHKFFLARKP